MNSIEFTQSVEFVKYYFKLILTLKLLKIVFCKCYRIFRISRIQFVVHLIFKMTKNIVFYKFYRFCRFERINFGKTRVATCTRWRIRAIYWYKECNARFSFIFSIVNIERTHKRNPQAHISVHLLHDLTWSWSYRVDLCCKFTMHRPAAMQLWLFKHLHFRDSLSKNFSFSKCLLFYTELF